MIEYKVLKDTTIEGLQNIVDTYIQNGWHLVGGVSFASLNYMQAVMWPN